MNMKFTKLCFLFAAIALGLLNRVCAADAADKSIEAQFDALPPFYFDTGSDAKNLFNSRGYLDLAVALQELGQTKAIAKLRELAKRPAPNKVVVLCRMLFVAKPKPRGELLEFRAPKWDGAAASLCVFRIRDIGRQLDPIAIVNGIPFLTTPGYESRGRPESAKSYLKYCIAQCDWNTQKYVSLRDENMENRASVDKQLNAACAKLLLLNLSKKQWLDSGLMSQWAKFMQAQTQGAADFSTRKGTLRYLLADDFDMASVPEERGEDFFEIVKACIQAEYLWRGQLVLKIQFISPDTATLQFSDGGKGVYLKKKNDKWVLEDGKRKSDKWQFSFIPVD